MFESTSMTKVTMHVVMNITPTTATPSPPNTYNYPWKLKRIHKNYQILLSDINLDILTMCITNLCSIPESYDNCNVDNHENIVNFR